MSRYRHSTDIRSVDKNLDKNPPQRQKSDSPTKFSTNIRAQTRMQKNICCFEYHLVLVVSITSFYHKSSIFIGFCRSYYLLIETAHNFFLWKMWNHYIMLTTCKFILKQFFSYFVLRIEKMTYYFVHLIPTRQSCKKLSFIGMPLHHYFFYVFFWHSLKTCKCFVSHF